jgi:hypothetical protein
MDSSRDSEFDARLEKIEEAIAGLQRSVDALLAERTPAAAPRSSSARQPPIAPRPRRSEWEGPTDAVSSWIASRSAEWWLSRVGIGFVVLAVVLLYGYAIDHGWITPPVRVLTGILVGAGLFGAAIRISPPGKVREDTELGLRELLFGGGLAVWYVTAYAAAVWYELIPVPAARLAFFVLGIVSTWIALEERREIFGVLAVATGFAAPFILPAPVQSATELRLYLGAMASIGLIIYLMRGWHSIIWITFIAFWMSVAMQTSSGDFLGPAAIGSVALSLLVIAAGAAFTRAPLLRRRLLALGSPRYTATPIPNGIEGLMEAIDSLSGALGGGKSAPDSLIVWSLTLLSPVLAIGFLSQIWPRVPDEFSGVVLILLGAGALLLFRQEPKLNAEIAHVEVTAAMLWTVIGVGRIITTPESLPASAVLAALAINGVPRQFVGPRVLAKLTIVVVLLSIAGHELSFIDTGLVRLRWFISEVIALGAIAFIARKLIGEPNEKMQGVVVGTAGYFTALLILWRLLEPVWAPLVTASYAVIGAGLLILSRRKGGHTLLRYLGAATMLIVAARLLLVDLSSVETIWRVLLFLVCGAVFLYTGYQMQPGRAGADKK